MKKIILISLVVICISLSANEEAVQELKAHNFKLENIKGEMIELSDLYKEKLVILDFWASWCVPCKKALPKLDELQKKYQDQIQVVAIDVDKARHVSKAKSYVKSRRFSFEILFDTDHKVMKLYNVKNPPNTFIISTDGEIIWSHLGYKNGDEKKIEEQIIKWIEAQKDDAENLKAVEEKVE